MTEIYKYRISVIIPVYNVEDYLHRCVESVLNQTMDGLEIILVDDGSPDNCPIICDDYAKKYRNVVVFHKSNGGLSSARNVGINHANGKYIFFLDSDDWLDSDGLERLYRVAEETGVDFVRYRSMRSGWPGLPENVPTRVEEPRELTGGYYSLDRIQKEIYPRLFATRQLTLGPIVGAWGSLYKTALLADNHIVFDEKIKYSEDIPFSAQVVLCAKDFYFIDEPGTYHYWYNKNSISKSFKSGRWNACKQIINDSEKIVSGNKEFEKQLNYLRWFCIFLSINEGRWTKSGKEKRKYISVILNDEMTKKATIKNADFDISFRQLLMIFLVKLRMSGIIARI